MLECEGHGRNVQKQTCTINIPAGVDNGQTLRTQLGTVRLEYILLKILIYFLANCLRCT